MATSNTFNCPTCDAPLPVTGDESEIKCQYCGNMVVVPPSLRGTTAPAQGLPPYAAGQSMPQTMKPRRTGFSWLSCLTVIAVLLLIALIAFGLFVAIAPTQLNQVMTQVNNAVQPAVADIGIFSVDPSLATNNSVVTFRWAVNSTGNTVIRLDRVIDGNTLTLLPSLPSVGNSTYQVTGKPGDKITFKLISTRNGASTEKSVVVTIK